MELMQASHQWATRPADQRFTSLPELHSYLANERAHSLASVVSSRRIEAAPADDNRGLLITTGNGTAFAPSNFSFGQLSTLAGAPAGYLRSLPAPMAVDCINYGMQYARDAEEVGLLTYQNGGAPTLRASTSSAKPASFCRQRKGASWR